MLTNYITYSELLDTAPRLERWIESDTEAVRALNTATRDVGNDLRKRGDDISRLYVPLVFDAGDYADDVAKTANYTSAGLEADNELRFVVEIRSDVSCVFRLESSEDDTTYRPARGVDGADVVLNLSTVGRYGVVLLEPSRYYRYTLETSASTVYRAFMVETGCDRLIMYKAIELLMFPLLGDSEATRAVYGEAAAKYVDALSGLVLDYDADRDGAIDTEERNNTVRRMAWR